MKKTIPVILFCGLSALRVAAADIDPNYCHDTEKNQSNEDLLKNNPDDPLIIRLIALRLGLCALIETGKIDLERGIDLFEDEKNKAIFERRQEELRTRVEKLS